ncbi:MAG: phosphate signaling complex protein PhoU [Gammaproteobacteria bacterium]|nr:phosphate signaling complex protein PhoU [Gammaproteobacteria bacterium]MCP5299520.1 phosphate signaling complex protein PhoU [Chromatiaceae bacterium]
MDTSDLKHHYSQQFNSELEELRSRVLAMGGTVEQHLELAIEALGTGVSAGAETVVANDHKVNAFDVEIDERCTKILALRQPTASDLRLVLAVIKTTADLERIGDEAKRVASMAIRAASGEHGRNLYGQIVHLGNQVQQMLHSVLDAFARMDVQAAVQVAHEDVNIDREYESVMRQSMTYMMEDPRAIPSVLDLIWAARALERIGDRCCNISEYIIYFVKGKDVRHTSLDDIRKEIS